MKLFHPSIKSRKSLAALLCSGFLIACDSGGSGAGLAKNDAAELEEVNSDTIDDPAEEEFVSTGELVREVNQTNLRFSIAEDTSLVGAFAGPFEPANNAQGEPANGDDFDMDFGEFTILSLPDYGLLQLTASGSSFSYEPDVNYFGVDSFQYATSSGEEVTVEINVLPVPDAPAINRAIEPTANQGRRYQAVIQVFDADGDTVTLTAENLPYWLSLDGASGILTGVPGQEDVGAINDIRITATDSTGLKDVIEELQLEVVDINDVPILNLTQAPRELFGNQKTNFNVFPRDVENDRVKVSVEPNEALTIAVTGSQIKIEVGDIPHVQSTELVITATDDRGASTREIVPIDLYPRTASGKGTTLVGYKQGRGVHIVILGDGYAVDEMGTYREHVESVLANIRSDAGIAEHLGALNIHMIETVSQQSGADDSDTNDRVTTAFDAAYNCRAIPRLVCADVLKLFEASLEEYPEMDQIILLVNDSRYGGSGNSGSRVAITSAFYPEIALHEMGHSLADLADEYVDPLILDVSGALPFTEGRYTNVSNLNDPQGVPWAHWINYQESLPDTAADLGVGVFEGGFYRSNGVYRATANSRMRDYRQGFGPVNTEQWILRLYTWTEGIRSIFPEAQNLQSVVGNTLQFRVEPIFGDTVQRVEWSVNDQPLAFEANVSLSMPDADAISATTNDNTTELSLSLPAGKHTLSVTVSDVSGRIQIAPPHAGIYTHEWSIDVL